MPVSITINNAVITEDDGTVTHATITGDAEIQKPTTPPGTGDEHPAHPILLPPPSTGDQFWLLIYCTEPPPPHWEWISFTPGSPPERPHPQPPPDGGTTPPGEKPFPPDGGWGFKEPWGWIYWPGPGGAGPKSKK